MIDRIPPDTALVIFDMYDTLVAYGPPAKGFTPKDELDLYQLRNGVRELLGGIKDKKIAVCSDGTYKKIQTILERRLGEYASRIRVYAEENLGILRGEIYTRIGDVQDVSEILPLSISETKIFKDLGYICRELGVLPRCTVMIGDNYQGLDQISAEHFGIRFIQVPSRESVPDFSFIQLLP